MYVEGTLDKSERLNMMMEILCLEKYQKKTVYKEFLGQGD